MNTAKNMTSSAVSAFANIPAVSETVDKTFNMPGFTKQASEYLQTKLQTTAPLPPPPPTPPKAMEKWPLLAKVVGGVLAIVVLYFLIDGQTKTPQVGSAVPLSAEDELSKMEPYGKSKRGPLWMLMLGLGIFLLAVAIIYLRPRFAKMFSGSPARSRTLSSRRSYYPPRSCRYQLKTK